jgi:DNA replication protein DnaC
LLETLELLQHCGVPIPIAKAIVAGLDETVATRGVRAWLAQHEKSFLLLHGDVGPGKTWAAAAALRRCRRELVRFVDATGAPGVRLGMPNGWFLSAMKLALLSPFTSDGARKLADAEHVETLVLDDLGAETLDQTGYALQRVQGVLAERHAHRRLTVITTNLTPLQLGQRYGARIGDRLMQEAMAVHCPGPSLRRSA